MPDSDCRFRPGTVFERSLELIVADQVYRKGGRYRSQRAPLHPGIFHSTVLLPIIIIITASKVYRISPELRGIVVYKALLGFACVLLSAIAAGAQTVYISDDVGVYLHRGPSNQFKLIGTVPAGSRVTLVDRNEMAGYVKIVDGEGKSGWLENRFVSTEISRRERLASVERELEQLKEQFKGSGSKLAAYQSELTQLKHQNQTLDHEAKLRSSEVMRLQNELAGKGPTKSDQMVSDRRGGACGGYCAGIAGAALDETAPP